MNMIYDTTNLIFMMCVYIYIDVQDIHHLMWKTIPLPPSPQPQRLVFEDDAVVDLGEEAWLQRSPSKGTSLEAGDEGNVVEDWWFGT
jgi:hypothetical protein